MPMSKQHIDDRSAYRSTVLDNQLTTDVVNLALERCELTSMPFELGRTAIAQWLGHGGVSADVCKEFAKASRVDLPFGADVDDLDIVIFVANEAADIMWGG